MKKSYSIAERFLWLGVLSLAVAGLYSLVPVIGRTPQLKGLPIMQQFFDVALMVHVDLSVLVWFLAMLGLGTAQLLARHGVQWRFWAHAGWMALALSALLMTFSPLGAWQPVKSNYVPVLHNLPFLFALGLFAAGLIASFLPVALTCLRPAIWTKLHGAERGYALGALVVLLALLGFYLSAQALEPGMDLLPRYEQLFWGGGHVLQFSFALLVMASWLVVLDAIGGTAPSRRWENIAYLLTMLGAVMSLAGYLRHPTNDVEFTTYQTRIMIELGGVGATVMACLVLRKLLQTPARRATRAYTASLVASLVLFFAGGVLGLMISGQNVTIPAHYHGMIVGITLALMGVAYAMLPRFGYRDVAASRMAFLQPIIYAVGQLMHIGGLAYCGGYGILRKTAGGFEQLAPDIKIALGIFGFGGLLAVIGGILFVVVMLRAWFGPSASPQQTGV